jgi:Zn-dependent protease with chaperone function
MADLAQNTLHIDRPAKTSDQHAPASTNVAVKIDSDSKTVRAPSKNSLTIHQQSATLPRGARARIDSKIISLSLKNLAAETILTTTMVGIIASGYTLILTHTPLITPALCATIGIGLFALNRRAAFLRTQEILNQKASPDLEDLRIRAQGMANTVARQFHITTPKVIVCDKGQLGELIRRRRSPNLITISPELRGFEDSELKAVIAHEVAHCNRPYLHFNEIRKLLQSLAYPVAFAGSATLACQGAVQLLGTTAGYYATACLATLASYLAIEFSDRLGRYISHNNELKTDLRALRKTGNSGGLIGALEKTRQIQPDSDDTSSQAHPSFRTRRTNIEQVIGIGGRL